MKKVMRNNPTMKMTLNQLKKSPTLPKIGTLKISSLTKMRPKKTNLFTKASNKSNKLQSIQLKSL